MLAIALTGDVGAGKSTVLKWFQSQGAQILDADKITHQLWQSEEMLTLATERWGAQIIDQLTKTIDRKAVAQIIFSDDDQYRWLCDILHPLVFDQMEKSLSAYQGIVIAEIPLLFESGVPPWIDGVAYLSAHIHHRASRNIQRGLDEPEILRREKFFADRTQKMNQSDFIIENDGSLEDLYATLQDLYRQFLQMDQIIQIDFDQSHYAQAQKLYAKALIYQIDCLENTCRSYCLPGYLPHIKDLNPTRQPVRALKVFKRRHILNYLLKE